jgi:hypothetical protein
MSPLSRFKACTILDVKLMNLCNDDVTCVAENVFVLELEPGIQGSPISN